jgi:putative tryptophan/tyrosine transport system substrate-binding protein
VSVEHHHFDRRFYRLPELVLDLTRRRVAVICTITNAVAMAVSRARTDVPLVFAFGLDPVAMGLVKAFDHPGGNATGVFAPVTALDPKRLELLVEFVPELRVVAVLLNPANPNAAALADLRAAADKFGLELLVLHARDAQEIEAAFADARQRNARAVLVTSDAIFEVHRERLFEATARDGLPAIYPWREYVEAGGLLSYGNDLTDAARLVGRYAGRILNGDKPSDLPIEQPTKFELFINLRTAKALGLTIPPTLLARADEVIE